MLLAWLILGFTFLNAQFIHSYGVKTGCVIANQNFDYTDNSFNLDTQNRYGLNIGTFIEFAYNSNLHLLIETHYIQKGMVIEISEYDSQLNYIGKNEINNRVDYLSLPVLGKIAYKFKKLSPYIIVGPRIDILLGYDSDFAAIVYDEFESIDFGGTLGLGNEFSFIGSQTFLIEIRYSPSFTNSYEADLLRVKNNSFELLGGIKF